jgi:hypothetical protein
MNLSHEEEPVRPSLHRVTVNVRIQIEEVDHRPRLQVHHRIQRNHLDGGRCRAIRIHGDLGPDDRDFQTFQEETKVKWLA